ncbi:MAG: PAS domain-containing protein [Rhodospirillaceae bacterium]|nr:PAS domain-containing protein [Rhodospirillaceae bacterium]
MSGFDADAFAAQIRHPVLRRMFAYWRDKAGARNMPTRADLDPIDFPYALGYVMLVEVERAPLRFRFRLYGSALVKYFADGDYTGKYADQLLPPDYAPFVVAAYTTAVEGGVPRHAQREMVIDRQILNYDVLTLPLAHVRNPDEIAMLLVVMIPAPSMPVL